MLICVCWVAACVVAFAALAGWSTVRGDATWQMLAHCAVPPASSIRSDLHSSCTPSSRRPHCATHLYGRSVWLAFIAEHRCPQGLKADPPCRVHRSGCSLQACICPCKHSRPVPSAVRREDRAVETLCGVGSTSVGMQASAHSVPLAHSFSLALFPPLHAART